MPGDVPFSESLNSLKQQILTPFSDAIKKNLPDVLQKKFSDIISPKPQIINLTVNNHNYKAPGQIIHHHNYPTPPPVDYPAGIPTHLSSNPLSPEGSSSPFASISEGWSTLDSSTSLFNLFFFFSLSYGWFFYTQSINFESRLLKKISYDHALEILIWQELKNMK